MIGKATIALLLGGLSCLGLGVERADAVVPPVVSQVSYPLAERFAEVDAAESAGVVAPDWLVLPVFPGRYHAKIHASVVQPISVDVVDLHEPWGAHEEAMEKDSCSATLAKAMAHHIAGVLLGVHAPTVLARHRRIFGVYHGDPSWPVGVVDKHDLSNVTSDADLVWPSRPERFEFRTAPPLTVVRVAESATAKRAVTSGKTTGFHTQYDDMKPRWGLT